MSTQAFGMGNLPHVPCNPSRPVRAARGARARATRAASRRLTPSRRARAARVAVPRAQPTGVLKKETSYAANKPPTRDSGKPKLVWNDADGGRLEEVHFAERLHYSLKEDEESAMEQCVRARRPPSGGAARRRARSLIVAPRALLRPLPSRRRNRRSRGAGASAHQKQPRGCCTIS